MAKPILIALLTWKTNLWLERALASLCRSKDASLYDIIVLDNNDKEAQFTVKDYDIKEYLPRTINSITGAYNQAIDYFMTGDWKYISFYCADWVYSDGAFPEMLECLEKDEKYGCATAISNYCATSECFMSDHSLDYLRSLRVYLSPESLREISNTTGSILHDLRKSVITESQFFCIGFLCKRRMVEEVGKFNEAIQSMNDVEYSLRAFKKGWKSIVCHGAFLLHLEMHASWSRRVTKEHLEAEKSDRDIISNNSMYEPNEVLYAHPFWERCLKDFYKLRVPVVKPVVF